jgi:AcrR family transcriptional regulator
MTTSVSEQQKKRKRGIATRQAILDTAAEQFAQRGYDGVTVRDIAAAVGIQESSIYNHYPSKTKILDTLFQRFVHEVPSTRPTDEQLDMMLTTLTPEEIFRNILFHVGEHVKGTLSNIAMIITHEKFKNQRAAVVYIKYIVQEPASYYERLIDKMISRGMVRPVDARLFAEQYNYVSISLTQEYQMSQYGFADAHVVVSNMIKTLRFFCNMMMLPKDSHNEPGTPEHLNK